MKVKATRPRTTEHNTVTETLPIREETKLTPSMVQQEQGRTVTSTKRITPTKLGKKQQQLPITKKEAQRRELQKPQEKK